MSDRQRLTLNLKHGDGVDHMAMDPDSEEEDKKERSNKAKKLNMTIVVVEIVHELSPRHRKRAKKKISYRKRS